MITKTDVKTLEKTFATKKELLKVDGSVHSLQEEVRDLKNEMRAGFKEMTKGFQIMIGMFGKVFEKLDDLNGVKNNHEIRITKLEKEVFPQM